MSSQVDLPADNAGGAAPDTRRIPKSISWLLFMLLLAVISIYNSSTDLLPIIYEFSEIYYGSEYDNNSSKPVVSSGQNNHSGHQFHTNTNETITVRSNHSQSKMSGFTQNYNRSEPVVSLWQNNHSGHQLYTQIDANRTTNLRSNHSVSKISNDSDDRITGDGGCNFCQGEDRLFNPSIRLENGYTCARIKHELAANAKYIDEGKCGEFQKVENLCCPRSNWTHFWEKNTADCFYLNNICHAPHDGKWFYDRSALQSSKHSNRHKRQPTIEYRRFSHHSTVWPDYRIHFNVSRATTYSGNLTECPYSFTPHHVVSQSAYNHMIGEFYTRQMIGLNKWMRDFPPESDQDIQMYIHIPAIKARLFDGHRLFMNALPHRGEVDSFLSLVQGKDSCECYQTLAFCGYERATSESTDGQSRNHTFNLTGSITYDGIDGGKWCHSKKKRLSNNCTTYNDFRHDLLTHYARKDPQLQQKISDYRHHILSVVAGVPSDEVNNERDWKIVGLTDRKSRRVWLNIDDSVKACDAFRAQKVVCITVNVEKAASPEDQLMMHSSLDALVGVHGAQLTQGITLPRHGYILELLPWIPDWAWGDWVARTSAPTPLGIIFHNTDLNHLGYKLGRASVPICKDMDFNETGLKECFKSDKDGWLWDKRNFEVEPDVITRFVSSFLLQNDTNCDDMKAHAAENEYVFYNAFCSHGVEGEFSTEHYYWKENATVPRNRKG